MGHRLAPGEELAADGGAVDAVNQRPAHAHVGEDGIAQIEVDVLVDEPRLVNELEAPSVAALQSQCLIEGEAELAGDHVDGPRQQVGLERRRVADDAHDDAPEMGLRPPPCGVGLEHHMRSRHYFGDQVGPEIEPLVGGVGIEGGAVLVVGGVGEGLALEVLRQQPESVDGVVLEGELVEVHGEGLVVHHVDGLEAAVELHVADAAQGVAADLPGEDHVGAGHRGAVAPAGVGTDGVGDGDAAFAVCRALGHGAAVLDGGQLGAQHADQPPVLVVGGERAPRHGQHVGLGHHGVDVGMEGRRELGDADDQFVLARRGRGRCRRRAHRQAEE